MFSENVDNADIIHQALDYLITNNYMLTFNGSSISDLLLLEYPGVFVNGGKSGDNSRFLQVNRFTILHGKCV